MFAALGVFMAGAGLTASGVLWSGMYDIGVMVILVGAVGLVVRAADWLRETRR